MCVVSRPATEGDLDAGLVSESAVAVGTDPVNPVVSSNASTAAVTTVAAITVTVTAVTTDVNADGVIDPGDRVDWEVTATNTGRTAVTDLNLTDSLGNVVACNQSELVRDAKTVCALATYTIGASDAGSTVTNTLVASGVDLPGVNVTSFGTSASVVVHDEPPQASSLALAGTNARLALIIVSMLVAFGGLFVLAGHRRRRRVL